MAELRRTKAGPFTEENIISLTDLADAFHYYNEADETQLRNIIKPIESAIQHLPKVWITDTAVDALCHGAYLALPGISKLESGIEPDQDVAMLTLKGELIGVGKAALNSEKMLENKGIAIKTDKIVMEPGTYPSINKKL